jgi:hypothetical protein
MRLLVGDDRGNHHQHPGAILANGGVPSRMVVPRRLELLPEHEHQQQQHNNTDDDDTSDLDPNDPQSQYARFFGLEPGNGENDENGDQESMLHTPVARAVMTEATFETASSKDEDDDDDDDDEDPTLEMSILSDAVTAGLNNYYNMAYGMAVDSAVSVTSVFTGRIMRTSLTITLLGAGIGTLGLVTGVYDTQTLWQSLPFFGGRRSSSTTTERGLVGLSFPLSSTLMSTTLASAGTASLMMLFGWRVGNNNNNNDDNNQKSKDKDKPKKS